MTRQNRSYVAETGLAAIGKQAFTSPQGTGNASFSVGFGHELQRALRYERLVLRLKGN
jgi:hypothetical protein